MPDVFVSYKSEDRELAARMVRALEGAGLDVWWDQHIGMGSVWRAEVSENLDAAKAVVVLWTDRSVGAGGRFVQEEAQRALDRGTYQPVLMENVALPLGFTSIQAHQLIDWNGGTTPEFESLLQVLHRQVGLSDTHSVPTAREPAQRSDGGMRSAGTSERRTITLLRGSLPHDGELHDDPEVLDEIILRIEGRLSELVDSERAALLHLDNDGFTIVLGAAGAREDDDSAAADLALSLKNALHEDPGIEVGLALVSGLAVVTLSPSLRVSGALMSHSAELVRKAGPGELVVDQTMARRLQSGFDIVSSEGDISIVRQRSGTHSAQMSPAHGGTAFVGRDEELRRLHQALRLADSGQGRALCFVGEPGIGKSRLLHEFLHQCGDKGALVAQATCRSLDMTRPYGAFADIAWSLLDRAQLQAGSAAQPASEQLLARFPDLADYIPCLLGLLDLDDEGQAQASRALVGESIQAMMVALAEKQALVLLIDDLHLADEATLEILLNTAEICGAFRILLLTGTRPASAPAWPAMPHCEQVILDSLDEAEIERLISNAAGGATVEPALARLVHGRTDGVPLFAEELVRVLLADEQIKIDDGQLKASQPIDRVRLPRSIDAVVRSRLDSLEPQLRDALRTAAVIGRQFKWRLLRDLISVSGPPGLLLGPAVSNGILQQIRIGTDAEYRFRHLLTHEVAYDSILSRQRRQLHLAIGNWIEADGAGALEDHAEALAHHFLVAEDLDKAIRYQISAGEKALSWGSVRVATEFFSTAVKLIESLDPDEQSAEQLLDALVLQGNALMLSNGYNSAHMRTVLARVQQLSGSLPAGNTRLSATWWLWRVDYNRNSMLDAQQSVAALHDVAEASGDPLHRLAAFTADGINAFFMGEFGRAIDCLEQADGFSARIDPSNEGSLSEISPEIWLACFRGLVKVYAGQIDDGLELMRKAERLAVDKAHPHLESFVQIYLQMAAGGLGDADMWRAANDRAAELARRHELGHWGTTNLLLSGVLELVVGNVAAAIETLDSGKALVSEVGTGMLIGMKVGLAMLKAALGDLEQAVIQLDDIKREMAQYHIYNMAPEVAFRLLMVDRNNVDRRLAEAREVLERTTANGNRLGSLRLANGIAHALSLRGETAAAIECLAPQIAPFDGTARQRWPSIAVAAQQLASLEAKIAEEV